MAHIWKEGSLVWGLVQTFATSSGFRFQPPVVSSPRPVSQALFFSGQPVLPRQWGFSYSFPATAWKQLGSRPRSSPVLLLFSPWVPHLLNPGSQHTTRQRLKQTPCALQPSASSPLWNWCQLSPLPPFWAPPLEKNPLEKCNNEYGTLSV